MACMENKAVLGKASFFRSLQTECINVYLHECMCLCMDGWMYASMYLYTKCFTVNILRIFRATSPHNDFLF